MPKKPMSLYQLAKKEVIDYIIVKKLTEYQQYIIALAYGCDLTNPTRKKDFYDIIKKADLIKTIAAIKNFIPEVEQELSLSSNNPSEEIDIKEFLEKRETNPPVREFNLKEEQPQDLLLKRKKMLELLKNLFTGLKDSKYLELLKSYEPEEVIIFLLVISNHDFLEIAEFMKVSLLEVIEITEKLMGAYPLFMDTLKALNKLYQENPEQVSKILIKK